VAADAGLSRQLRRAHHHGFIRQNAECNMAAQQRHRREHDDERADGPDGAIEEQEKKDRGNGIDGPNDSGREEARERKKRSNIQLGCVRQPRGKAQDHQTAGVAQHNCSLRPPTGADQERKHEHRRPGVGPRNCRKSQRSDLGATQDEEQQRGDDSERQPRDGVRRRQSAEGPIARAGAVRLGRQGLDSEDQRRACRAPQS
jgi:hypothetical protein